MQLSSLFDFGTFSEHRRRRMTSVMIAAVIAGVFMIYITRVFLVGVPDDEALQCGASDLYKGMSFEEARDHFHYWSDLLLEERMDLYEGRIPLVCSAEDLDEVIPLGPFASVLAEEFPNILTPGSSMYDNFVMIYTELWRNYDCHLATAMSDPVLLSEMFSSDDTLTNNATATVHDRISTTILLAERTLARGALDRVLEVIRPSEQYLPLHASLRCAQRGFTDVRNAMALFSDSMQCIQPSLADPHTSTFR